MTAKKSLSFLLLLFLLQLTLTSCDKKVQQESKVDLTESASVEELGQANRDFAKALTDHDAVAAAAIYDENATILPPNELMIKGRANIQKYWQAGIDAGIVDASVKTIDARSTGDIGYEIGTFQMKIKGPKGDTLVENGKYTEILKRTADGKWISTHGMWSANEPAPAQ